MKTSSVLIFIIAVVLAGCGGGSGSDTPASLTNESTVAVLSESCPFGGVTTDTGLDTNADGVLSPSEVTSSSTVCNDADAPAVDTALRNAIGNSGLTGDLTSGRVLPDINDPLAQLGLKLFFSKALGGDQDSACVSCHHPFLGGGDGLSLSIGVGAEVHDLLGPGRMHSAQSVHYDGGPTVPRNAPTTYNIVLWEKVLFHDGRIESLVQVPGMNGSAGNIRTPDSAFGIPDTASLPNLTVAQARFPVTSAEEMRGFDFEVGKSNSSVRDQLAKRLQGITNELATNEWLEAFRLGFETPSGSAAELITFDNIALAIAEYERSQVFVSTPFSDYVRGNNTAINGEAKLGALLFYGEAGCSGCHSGDFMTDENFHVLAMPQIGRGKGDGPTGDNDFGRFRETKVEKDRYAFRTPTLLNVAATGPWGHAGAYTDLASVVRHHADPRLAIEAFDPSQIQNGIQIANTLPNTLAALQQLENLRATGDSLLPQINLSEEDVSRLVAFLESLTDPCIADIACIGQWVPGIADSDPDALRVQAIDRLGNALQP